MRGKKLRQLGALTLAVTLLLAGCGGDKDAEKTSKSSIPVSGVNEFPIVEEPVTLSIFCEKSASVADIETNEFVKWYEDKTNVHIDWNLITGDVRQAINLQIASEDYSDIFLGFGFARSEQAAYYDQGVFIDLTDLVDEHGYYIKKVFEEIPEMEPGLRHSYDKILGLCGSKGNFEGRTPNKMWVYEPWMKKLGAEIPQTTDEFYELLKRFKTEDPNGNGKADEIPLAARNNRGGEIGLDLFLMNSFLTWGKYGFTIDENGDAVFAPIQDEAREGIRYMRKLYKEGLIHPDSFIMDRARVTALGENEVPILGAATGRWTSQFTVAGAPSNRTNEFVAIPPLEGPKGVRQSIGSAGGYGTTSFSVTSACEYPEVAIKWVDWFFSEDAYLKNAADGFREAKEGEIGLDGKPARFAIDEVKKDTNSGTVQNRTWSSGSFYWPYENTIAVKDNTIDAVRLQNSYKAYEMYEPYKVDDTTVVDFPVPTDKAEEYLEYRANFIAAIDSGFVGFIIGEKDIDKDWDAYVQNFYDLGLEGYTKIVQDWLDTLK